MYYRTNSFDTVLTNVMQSFVLVAMKLHTYLKELRRCGGQNLHFHWMESKFLKRKEKEMINVCVFILKRMCR